MERLSSVHNAVRILQAFSDDSPFLGITDLSGRLGLAKSTVYRLIQTLRGAGLVEQDGETRKYQIGLGAFVIGSAVYRRTAIRHRVMPVLADLADNTRRVVRLGVYSPEGVVYICKVPENKATTEFTTIGSRSSAHSTAVGKLLLAYQSQNEIRRVLSGPLAVFTPRTVIQAAALEEQLKKIVKDRLAVSNEEHTRGLCSLAVPVFGPHDNVIAGLSVTGSRNLLLSSTLNGVVREMLIASQRIATSLAWD